MRQNILSILAIVISTISLFYGRIETMQFSQLIEKVAKGETLDPIEQQQLVFEARNLEQAAYLLNNIVQPGTQTLKIDNAAFNDVIIANEDVELNQYGVILKNQEGAIYLEDSNGNPYNLSVNISPNDDLQIVNQIAGEEIQLYIKLTTGDDIAVTSVGEDAAQADRNVLTVGAGDQGARIDLKGAGGVGQIDLRTEGDSGGSTFMRMLETTNTPPAGSDDAFHMYMKGDKLIIQFNAAGTAHYFFLDLTATSNQSWIYSATAP